MTDLYILGNLKQEDNDLPQVLRANKCFLKRNVEIMIVKRLKEK